ncbi:MAG TPA: hypothetical protein VF232_01820 [Gaiellaceae bacterium]
MRHDSFDLTSRPPVIGRIVTGTVALVCVLIAYDGWAALTVFGVVLVIVGPVVAICTTHIFSGSLVQLVTLGRRPTMREWLATVRFELRFLLLAVPPLAVLLGVHLANVALTDTVQVIIWLEALSLSLWAGLAAWYAGLRGRLLGLSILAGLVIGVVVLLLEVILQPGKVAA